MKTSFSAQAAPKRLSNDYANAFRTWARGGGATSMSAIMSEGLSTDGGQAIPVVVDQTIVPLAPLDSAVLRLAHVVTTQADVTIPYETLAGTAAVKPESGPTLTTFTNTSATLAGVRLRAFMVGAENDFSRELFDDAAFFTSFVVGSMLRSQQTVEDAKFISGSGVGEAQGMLGHVGSGTLEEPDSAGNLVTVSGLLNLIETLKAEYHGKASFLLNRVTGTNLRKSQLGVPGEPLFTRENGQDYLLGYPVEYSNAMPVAARGSSPILFGDFESAYVIGFRGDQDLKVKVLDQDPSKAMAGVVGLLTYRRSDGRVRQPEALQQLNIAAS